MVFHKIIIIIIIKLKKPREDIMRQVMNILEVGLNATTSSHQLDQSAKESSFVSMLDSNSGIEF